MLNRISTKMIKGPFNDVKLFNSLYNKYEVNLYDFGYEGNDFSDALSKAHIFLLNRKFGRLIIPRIGNEREVIYEVVLENGQYILQLTSYFSRRYPINSEKRPYLNDEFRVNDVIRNISTLDENNTNRGWICVEEGGSGVWKPFEHIKEWYSQVERLDYYPQPSELQLGRQIYHTPSNRVSMCKQVGTEYKWVYIDYNNDNLPDIQFTTVRDYVITNKTAINHGIDWNIDKDSMMVIYKGIVLEENLNYKHISSNTSIAPIDWEFEENTSVRIIIFHSSKQ